MRPPEHAAAGRPPSAQRLHPPRPGLASPRAQTPSACAPDQKKPAVALNSGKDQAMTETPPDTPALLVRPEWSHKLDRRTRCTVTLQRVVRGHFVRRVWATPCHEIRQWRMYVKHQPVETRRPMLVHVQATNKQDEGWLGEAARPHLLVPIGCPDTVKWFPTPKAIKNWWYSVPDKIRRLFDISQAEVLPRWEEAKGYEAPKEFRGDRQVGPGSYTIKNTEVLHPRVTGGNFPRATRFGGTSNKGRALKASNASGRDSDGSRASVPRLKLAGEGGGDAADVSAASARISKSLNRGPAAEQQAADYKVRLAELAQRQAAAQQRMVEREQQEVEAARERIQSLKDDNKRQLQRMRKDLANCRHPLYAYGDRFAMAFVSPRVGAGGIAPRGWRGDKAPAWATFDRESGGRPGINETSKEGELVWNDSMAPLSERGMVREEKKGFFTLLNTISESKKGAFKKRRPQISEQAVVMASKYEGIGAKLAGIDLTAGGANADTHAILPEEGFDESASPTSPRGKKKKSSLNGTRSPRASQLEAHAAFSKNVSAEPAIPAGKHSHHQTPKDHAAARGGRADAPESDPLQGGIGRAPVDAMLQGTDLQHSLHHPDDIDGLSQSQQCGASAEKTFTGPKTPGKALVGRTRPSPGVREGKEEALSGAATDVRDAEPRKVSQGANAGLAVKKVQDDWQEYKKKSEQLPNSSNSGVAGGLGSDEAAGGGGGGGGGSGGMRKPFAFPKSKKTALPSTGADVAPAEPQADKALGAAQDPPGALVAGAVQKGAGDEQASGRVGIAGVGALGDGDAPIPGESRVQRMKRLQQQQQQQQQQHNDSAPPRRAPVGSRAVAGVSGRLTGGSDSGSDGDSSDESIFDADAMRAAIKQRGSGR